MSQGQDTEEKVDIDLCVPAFPFTVKTPSPPIAGGGRPRSCLGAASHGHERLL